MVSRLISAIAVAFFATLLVAGFFFVLSFFATRPQEADEEVIVQPQTLVARATEAWVVNPTTGSRWYVAVMIPAVANKTALILVPGERASSVQFAAAPYDIDPLLAAGYTVVLFDPEGRGQSEGVEDDGGIIQQDGLREVADFAAALSGIERVGLVSFSYGTTMAAGMLARHPNAPVAFLIDWEGAANRTHSGGCDADATGHLQKAGCTNEEFWAEREAERFVASIHVPYLRLQTERDDEQPDYDHAVAMINAAVAGDAPWVRLNDGDVGLRYTQGTVEPLPETFDRTRMSGIAALANEMVSVVLPSLQR